MELHWPDGLWEIAKPLIPQSHVPVVVTGSLLAVLPLIAASRCCSGTGGLD